MRRLLGAAVAVVLAAALSGGCAEKTADVEEDARVQAQLAQELDLTPEQAACAWIRMSAELDDDDVARVLEDGLTALPVAQWGDYVVSVLACTVRDEVSGSTDPAAGGR